MTSHHTDPARASVRERLETELRAALRQAGIANGAIRSVMGAGCRVDGIGAGAVPRQLEAASERARARIRLLAEALDRLDQGTYGRCQVCGEPIGSDRLEVLPTATRCRGCAD